MDTSIFNHEARLSRRSGSRQSLDLDDRDFVFLLIGNDWKKKGLDLLLRALAIIDIPIQLFVVGKDDPGLYRSALRQLRLDNRVRFLVPSADVLSFYAATDAYVAPSLEDAFGLPILEAMACGLPVIASVQAGASENIIDGTTGYLLRDPMNHVELAELIRRLAGDRSAAQKVGAAACPVRESFGQLGSQCFSDPQVFGRRVNFETHLKLVALTRPADKSLHALLASVRIRKC